MEELNTSLFLLINAGDFPAPAVFLLMTFLAKWLIYGVPLLLAGMWFWGGREARAAVLMSSVTLGIALTLNLLLGMVWMHPRPFMIGLGHQLLAHGAESSFPSDHATVFFAVALSMLTCQLHRSGWLLMVLGAMVGWARIYLGVHYPFDIVGALLTTTLCAWGAVTLLNTAAIGPNCLALLEHLYRRLFGQPISRGWIQP